jgi:hypothetical protein
LTGQISRKDQAMSWAARAAKNILPLSREKRQLAVALKEWFYTGDSTDLEAPEEDCELCDHPHIRYQFLIHNRETHQQLWIGSECINRFRISAVDDEGNILDTEATRRLVARDKNKLVTDAKKKRVVNALVQLAGHDEEFDIDDFLDYFHDRGAFTPNQLFVLIWRLAKFRIPHQKADFKLVLRRNREKAQLRQMEDWKIKKIWPCMNTSQQEICTRLRNGQDTDDSEG